MKTLKDVKVGKTVKVVKLHGEGPVKRRIMDMGITKGVEIYVRKVAPLGDPFELNLRGYELSLRKSDAEMVEEADSCRQYQYHAPRRKQKGISFYLHMLYTCYQDCLSVSVFIVVGFTEPIPSGKWFPDQVCSPRKCCLHGLPRSI